MYLTCHFVLHEHIISALVLLAQTAMTEISNAPT